jgi:hypothetical protein
MKHRKRQGAVMTEWASVPFIDYLSAVDDLLEQRFGITTNDCGLEHAAHAHEAGDTPEAFVAWIGEKYDLQDITTGLA